MPKTRLDLFKSASDFAFATLAETDPAAFDIKAAQQFQSDGQAVEDYSAWRQYVTACRNQFLMLKTQPAPSAGRKPAQPAVAPAPAENAAS
jgi:hypothetical protein